VVRVDTFSVVAGLVIAVLGIVAAAGGLGPLLDRPERVLPVLAAVLAVALVVSVLHGRDDDPVHPDRLP
jgi:peptidoglycan/LPS O-acetylase OafA/YrhL